MHREKKVGIVYDDKLHTDWRGDADISAQYAGSRQDILDMLAKFQKCGTNVSSRIDMSEPCIKLTTPDI